MFYKKLNVIRLALSLNLRFARIDFNVAEVLDKAILWKGEQGFQLYINVCDDYKNDLD